MRLGVLAVACACLAIAVRAEAKDTWFGAQVAFPTPAGDIGDSQLGIDVGVTLDHLNSPYAGVGLDVIYHYWPASAEYQAAFDRYLRKWRVQSIDSPTWAFSALQFTAHVKLVAPMAERHGPWFQLGGGVYRLNRNIAEPNWDNAFVIYVGRAGNIAHVPGWYASAGYDFPTRTNMVVGIDASFHRLSPEEKDVPEFSAFTIGTHVLFGW